MSRLIPEMRDVKLEEEEHKNLSESNDADLRTMLGESGIFAPIAYARSFLSLSADLSGMFLGLRSCRCQYAACRYRCRAGGWEEALKRDMKRGLMAPPQSHRRKSCCTKEQ
jgi:hypothetical protein